MIPADATIIDLADDASSGQDNQATIPAIGMRFVPVELPISPTARVDKGKQQLKRQHKYFDDVPAKKAKAGSTTTTVKVSSTTPVFEPCTLPPLKPIAEIASYYPFLYYKNPASKASIDNVATHEIIPHYYLDYDLLNKMGLGARVKNYIRSIGWENWLLNNDECPTYRELCLEFYSSLNIEEIVFNGRNLIAKNAIVFRLFGQDFSYSYNSFNQALGFSTKGMTDYPKEWKWEVAYIGLTGQPEPDQPQTSLQKKALRPKEGLALLNPELRFIHRLLAYKFSGRYYAASIISRTEVFVLESMLTKRPLNVGFWIVSQMYRLKQARRMLFGPVITRLAMKAMHFNKRGSSQFTPIDFSLWKHSMLWGSSTFTMSMFSVNKDAYQMKTVSSASNTRTITSLLTCIQTRRKKSWRRLRSRQLNLF